MKHLVIGQLQNLLNYRLFIGHHLEVRLSLVSFGNQHGSTFSETNRNGLIYHIGCLITIPDRNGPILVLVSTDFDHTGCLITLSDRNGPICDLVYPILIIFLT